MKHEAHWLAKVNSAMGIATRLWAARSVAQIPVGTKDIFSSPRPFDRPGNRPNLLLNGYHGPFRGLKRPEHEIHYSPPSRTDVKNNWIYTSSLSICLHGVNRDKFKYSKVLSYYSIIIIIIMN
jgi:hypothetical protein